MERISQNKKPWRRNCAILNYQGHGEFRAKNPLESRLKLGPKRLITVRDILQYLSLEFPALCTLFACESGLTTIPSSDDVMSLPTALHYAGASAVVSTLWAVDDVDGAAFGRRFYRELLATSKEAMSVE